MIEFPSDLIGVLVFFTMLALGSLVLATLPNADEPLFEDNDHE